MTQGLEVVAQMGTLMNLACMLLKCCVQQPHGHLIVAHPALWNVPSTQGMSGAMVPDIMVACH